MFIQPASVDLNKWIVFIYGAILHLIQIEPNIHRPITIYTTAERTINCLLGLGFLPGKPVRDLARCGGLDQQPSFTLIYCLAMPVRVKENLYLLEDKKIKNHILFIKKHLLYLSKSGCQTKHRKHTIIQFLLSMFAFIGNSANSNIDCSVVYCPEQENH